MDSLVNDPSYNAVLGSVINDPQMQQQEDQPTSQISTPDIVDGEIRSMILKRKEASRVSKQDKKEKWDQCIKHYNQIYDKTNKDAWQSTTFIPASPKVAEVICSNMHAALLSPDKPVEFQARLPIYERQVNDANDLISTDCDKSNFKTNFTDIMRTNCILGTGIGKSEYVKEYATVTIKKRNKQIPGMDMVRRLLGMQPAPQETITQEKILVKDFASTKWVDPYNIYPEPLSTEITKDNWIIEEGKICNYKLIELQSDPDNPVRNINTELLTTNPRTLQNPDAQEKDSAEGQINRPTAYLDPDQEHILDEYWGPAPIWMVQPELYGDESRKYEMVYAWFWLIDGIHVVRSQITPFRDAEPPYIKGVYIKVPGSFWGIGPLELMLGLQIELNESRNCRQDEINLKLSPPAAVIKSLIAEGERGRLEVGPGALWLFDNVDDVRKAVMKIELDANLQDSWRGSSEIYNEIQEVTAATKATIGTGGGTDQAGGDTFRGQLLNKQTSADRFLMYAKVFEKTALSKAYQKMYQRIYQYKSYEQAAQILGPLRGQQFEFTSPEEMDLIAKIVPLGVTTMENKGVKLAQMADEFKMFSGKTWFKEVDFARRMIVTGGDNDPDMFIMTDEEIKVLNDFKQKLAMAQMTGQLPSGGSQQPQRPQQNGQSQPISGNTPPPMNGQPRPAMPARGPGASPIDSTGSPLS